MATKLTPLIKGQKIRIENHERGTGSVNDWGKKGVHFHKICNASKEKFEIVIPLNYPDPPEIKQKGRRRSINSMDGKVRKEIEKAFKSKTDRDAFIREVYSYIQRNFINWKNSESEMKSVAERIGKAFGVSLNDDGPIAIKQGGHLLCYVQKMILTDDCTEYLMIFNFSKGYFQLGEKIADDVPVHISISKS